jgi:hypothetical protein
MTTRSPTKVVGGFWFVSQTQTLDRSESTMGKQKNHTARNQSSKAHRNGIKKARDYPAKSQKGVSICSHRYVSCVSLVIVFYVSTFNC